MPLSIRQANHLMNCFVPEPWVKDVDRSVLEQSVLTSGVDNSLQLTKG